MSVELRDKYVPFVLVFMDLTKLVLAVSASGSGYMVQAAA